MNILVTAGPTREYFDPVRFLSNPSSGKMGFALAESALAKKNDVTLISGPTALEVAHGIRRGRRSLRFIPVVSAEEMYRAVMKAAPAMDLIIMCAAVSDYRPQKRYSRKVKKDGRSLVLNLVPTRDILLTLGKRKKRGQILVGFAAETHDVEANARKKLIKKNLDWIVANRVGKKGGGFESDVNEALLLSKSGFKIPLASMSKRRMASRILEWVLSQCHATV